MARRWIFLIVIALAALAWLVGRPRTSGAAPVARPSVASVAEDVRLAFVAPPTPAELARPILEPALRDPFLPIEPPVPVVKAPPPPPPVVQAPPAPPTPPPMNLRFVGRMTAPDGGTIVLAAFGETTLTLVPGQTLPNGYRVDAIEPLAVRLTYTPMDAQARLDLPESPRYEIR